MSYPATQCDSTGDLKYAGDDDGLAHGEGAAANRGPKAAHRARFLIASVRGKTCYSTGPATAPMYTGLPVGHIIGANAKGKSIGEHSGAPKDHGQLCGHLRWHHVLFRYRSNIAIAFIISRAGSSVWPA